MIRRSTILLAAAAASLLTGCGTFDDDVVASVDGDAIDAAEFDVLADDFFGRDDLFGTATPSDGRIDGEQGRLLLSVLVRRDVLLDVVDGAGLDIAEQREAALATIDPSFDDVSDEMRSLIAESNPSFQSEVLADVPMATEDELAAMYDRSPLGVGAVCLRHILVETEAEADEIVALVRGGADFAELAAERSIDTSTAPAGGALASPSNDCIAIRTMTQGFDPAFAGAVLAADGDLIGPVESSFGWHVILHRPWDEIGASVVALHTEADSGGYQLDGRLATADIHVDPQFGTWDRLAGGIVPLG